MHSCEVCLMLVQIHSEKTIKCDEFQWAIVDIDKIIRMLCVVPFKSKKAYSTHTHTHPHTQVS